MNDRDVLAKVDPLNMKQSVHQIVAFAMGLEHLGVDDDFFSRGMDSLQVIQTARYLKSGLQEAGMKVGNLGPSTIYTNPTIRKLASAVESFERKSQATRESAEKARIHNMEEIFKKYSTTPHTNQERSQALEAPLLETVVLTGSTGALGSYLLEEFFKSELISKVYCLNRSGDSKQRQVFSSASRGLTSQWSPERVTFLTSDYSKDDLGLDQEMFLEIRDRATIIVHNAWQVDFNLSLASYEHGHINGVRNLISRLNQPTEPRSFLSLASPASWLGQITTPGLSRRRSSPTSRFLKTWAMPNPSTFQNGFSVALAPNQISLSLFVESVKSPVPSRAHLDCGISRNGFQVSS